MSGDSTELVGDIIRIIFRSEDDGYTVATLKPRDRSDPVRVVGNFPATCEGEKLLVKGRWVEHPRYGPQLAVDSFQVKAPATVTGIRRYLASGAVRGIGPEMAGRIVNVFGDRALAVIDESPGELRKVQGIGKKRIAMITEAWKEQRGVRDVMVFLQSHGISPAYAGRIWKRYGAATLARLQKNPYRLAEDIVGIGFARADAVARSLGFAEDAPERINAGVVYVLSRSSEQGHVYLPHGELVDRCREILHVGAGQVEAALDKAVAESRLIVERSMAFPSTMEPGRAAVYTPDMFVAETGAAQRLKEVSMAGRSVPEIRPHTAIGAVEKRIPFKLAGLQREAVERAVTDKILVITGGPGTGKTTVLLAVLEVYRRLGAKVLLAAPTGRAAKRMAEATQQPAKTIHRLLEFSPQEGVFQKNDKNPLECDLLVVDEASMMDMALAWQLFRALPETATLIMVGDVNQLPSVGPGNVLRDIIDSQSVGVVRLTEIFRQARKSRIVTAAHSINTGVLPQFEGYSKENDLYFIEQEDTERVADIIVELVKERIPKRFGHDPVRQVQVLAPMRRGPVGAEALCTRLQEELNPGGKGLLKGARQFRLGDKVMQIKNNYEREVYNGDIGMVVRHDPENRNLVVRFDGRDIPYDITGLDEIVLAYATTVHKAQGSEYPAVVMPVVTSHYMLLQRNLIYTAITRGRSLVVLVGTRKALAMAVNNDRQAYRYSLLRQRLSV
ncbi:MAG: ATP-dependent RecD-like DNA helicase [Desulfatibacillaceae bacterium]